MKAFDKVFSMSENDSEIVRSAENRAKNLTPLNRQPKLNPELFGEYQILKACGFNQASRGEVAK